MWFSRRCGAVALLIFQFSFLDKLLTMSLLQCLQWACLTYCAHAESSYLHVAANLPRAICHSSSDQFFKQILVNFSDDYLRGALIWVRTTVHTRNLDARIILLIQRLRSTTKILLCEHFRKYGIQVCVLCHLSLSLPFIQFLLNVFSQLNFAIDSQTVQPAKYNGFTIHPTFEVVNEFPALVLLIMRSRVIHTCTFVISPTVMPLCIECRIFEDPRR